MCLKLKALGLALFAVMAMGALSASAVSASEFHSESASETVLKGSQTGTDVLTVNAGTIQCSEVTYEGSQAGATAAEVTVTPKYSGCTAFGFVSVPIDVNGCTFKPYFFGIKISCSGNPITITAFNCWVTIGSQQIGTGLSYTNTGSGSTRDIDITASLTGLKYTQHSKSFPGCTNGTFTNGTWKLSLTMRGFTLLGVQLGWWRT